MFSTRGQQWVRSLVNGNVNCIARNFNTTNSCLQSHYDTLGIPANSTQSDIKSAYYRLSKQYHPDRNQGSEMAVKKFREIAQAYEVLGNYRLRRLYDKGIVHTAGPQYANQHAEPEVEVEVEDDPQTKFYKSRFTKSTVSDTTGRTPIYNFDEWSRAHYGKSFKRRQDAQEKYTRKQEQKVAHGTSIQNEILLFGMIVCGVVIYTIFSLESAYDTPKARAIAANDAENKTSES